MIEKEVDVLVIGSGAGGGTVASELSSLCREGLTIAVLEQGPRLSREQFTGRELEMARTLYADSGGYLTKDMSMALAFARTYGGSTVVYTGTSLKIPEAVVKRWSVPDLNYQDLMDRSDKHMAANGVHPLEPDKLNDNNRLFRQGCDKLGYRVQQFPINVRGCRGAGVCNFGCPNGAKQGTDRVQLPAAEAEGVQVVTGCRAIRVGPGWCEACVSRPATGLDPIWEPGDYRIRARAIVISGGAVHSPALLAHSGMSDSLPVLGRYFTAHPALILVAQHDREITNYHGHPKSYYCDQFVESRKFLLETCMYFPFTTAKYLVGYGPDHSRMMSRMDRLQMILALAIDPPRWENRVTADGNGKPMVDYRLGPEVLDALHQSMRTAARIFFASGARRVHAPGGRKFFIEREEQDQIDSLIPRSGIRTGKVGVASAHLMGGCRMGRDSTDSVTDSHGRIHGVPGLYVADASLFPSCSEINPYVTIMALADRVADSVRHDLPELRHS